MTYLEKLEWKTAIINEIINLQKENLNTSLNNNGAGLYFVYII
jgi:hypothetical protein